MNKQAFARQWLTRMGDRSLESNFDTLMTDEGKRQQVFDQVGGARPSLWQRLNPLSAVKRVYTNSPAAQQKFQQLLKQRMADPQFVQRVFGHQADAGESALSELPQLGSSMSFATDPKNWARAFGSSADPAVRQRLHRLMTLYSTFGTKSASFISATKSYNPADRTDPVNRLMQQHFPYSATRDLLATDPSVTPYQKALLLSTMQRANPGKSTGAIGMRQLLPSVIGGGLGYVGGSLLSSMLALPQTQSRAFRWGAAALGSLVNNPKVGGL
jgi:hypothetical protein